MPDFVGNSRIKENALGGFLADIEMKTTLTKDEILTFSPNYQSDYYKENLTKGQYTAVAYLEMSLDKEGNQKIKISLVITFEIK